MLKKVFKKSQQILFFVTQRIYNRKTIGAKCKLFNDLNEFVMVGSYIEIFKTLKEKQKLNEMYFVLDWVTSNFYENEKLEQFLNEEL